jgi:hypothetical protein
VGELQWQRHTTQAIVMACTMMHPGAHCYAISLQCLRGQLCMVCAEASLCMSGNFCCCQTSVGAAVPPAHLTQGAEHAVSPFCSAGLQSAWVAADPTRSWRHCWLAAPCRVHGEGLLRFHFSAPPLVLHQACNTRKTWLHLQLSNQAEHIRTAALLVRHCFKLVCVAAIAAVLLASQNAADRVQGFTGHSLLDVCLAVECQHALTAQRQSHLTACPPSSGLCARAGVPPPDLPVAALPHVPTRLP